METRKKNRDKPMKIGQQKDQHTSQKTGFNKNKMEKIVLGTSMHHTFGLSKLLEKKNPRNTQTEPIGS